MKTITLTQGFVALVNNADFKYLNQWKWHADRNHHSVYALRNIRVGPGKRKRVGMHTQLMGTPPGKEVDHRNGNGLDNRRRNLRVCAHAHNSQNVRKPIDNSSGFKGVSWNRRSESWRAYIKTRRRQLHLGYFSNPRTAAKAYNEAAVRLFGKFARLNPV